MIHNAELPQRFSYYVFKSAHMLDYEQPDEFFVQLNQWKQTFQIMLIMW